MSIRKNLFLNICLWIAQILLAGMFLLAGIMKSSKPISELGESLPWVNNVPEILVRFIGISELMGAFGLLLPSLLRIKPMLTPLASIGIFAIMIFAIIYHISQNEFSVIGFNVFLAAIALFISWGRYKKAPISAR